jgi:hypothetical protein
MELMREKWTDQRLDDLSAKVDDLARRMDLRFDAIDRRFEAMERRFEGLEARFQRMQLITVTGFMSLAGLIVSLGGVMVVRG